MRTLPVLASITLALACGTPPEVKQPALQNERDATAADAVGAAASTGETSSIPGPPFRHDEMAEPPEGMAVKNCCGEPCSDEEKLVAAGYCESTELSYRLAGIWTIMKAAPDAQEQLEAGLRKGPLYVPGSGPEVFEACTVKGDTKMACLIVYTDERSAAAACKGPPREVTMSEIARQAKAKGYGVHVSCHRFFAVLEPDRLDGW